MKFPSLQILCFGSCFAIFFFNVDLFCDSIVGDVRCILNLKSDCRSFIFSAISNDGINSIKWVQMENWHRSHTKKTFRVV